jgi:hypothetical protein
MSLSEEDWKDHCVVNFAVIANRTIAAATHEQTMRVCQRVRPDRGDALSFSQFELDRNGSECRSWITIRLSNAYHAVPGSALEAIVAWPTASFSAVLGIVAERDGTISAACAASIFAFSVSALNGLMM